jgi:hypothetical protein
MLIVRADGLVSNWASESARLEKPRPLCPNRCWSRFERCRRISVPPGIGQLTGNILKLSRRDLNRARPARLESGPSEGTSLVRKPSVD